MSMLMTTRLALRTASAMAVREARRDVAERGRGLLVPTGDVVVGAEHARGEPRGEHRAEDRDEHGDGEHALDFARRLRAAFAGRNIQVSAEVEE